MNLDQYRDLFRRRKGVFAAVAVLVVGVGMTVSFLTPPVYESSVVFQTPTLPALMAPSLSQATEGMGVNSQSAAPTSGEGQQLILQGKPFLLSLLRENGILPDPTKLPPAITASVQEATGSIKVTVLAAEAKQAAQLVNAVPQHYSKWLEKTRRTEFMKALAAGVDERNKAERQLAQAERKLVAFRSKHPLEQMNSERTTQFQERLDTQTRLRTAKQELRGLEAQVRVVRARLAKEPREIVERTTAPNAWRGTLKERLAGLELEKTTLLRDFRPQSDEVQVVENNIVAVKAQIAAEPEAIVNEMRVPNPRRETLETKLTDAEASMQAARAQYAVLVSTPAAPRQTVTPAQSARLELEQARLVNERDAIQGIYLDLAKQARSLSIMSDRLKAPAVDFQPAGLPTSPVSPRRERDLVVSLALALVLASAVVFLLDYLDDRAYSRDDLVRVTGLPTLAQVPLIGSRQPRMLTAMSGHSAIVEAYRSLRSNVGFAGLDSQIRRLMITSAGSEEGKTLTAINLALAMAKDGKRVALVDADLRRPTVHRHLEMALGPGLSDYLKGDVDLAGVLRETSEGLLVMPAGNIPADPAELLGKERFGELMEQLGERADVVILDSPPCLNVSDPLLIASHTDGVLLVVRAGYTRMPAVAAAEELLHRSRARVLGMVLNRAEGGGSFYYASYNPYPSSAPANGVKAGQNGHLPVSRD